MSHRFFALSVLGLALFLGATPASAVSLTVNNTSQDADSYQVILFINSDSGGAATFSSCGSGSCSFWDVNVTISEEPNSGDSPFVYSGNATHLGGGTLFFSGLYRIADGNGGTAEQVAHGTEIDAYGHGIGRVGNQYFFLITGSHAVPEPAAALLLTTALAGLLSRRGRAATRRA